MRGEPMFKKGDRVVLIENDPDDNEDLYIGSAGTVMTINDGDCDPEDELWVGVWWDDEIERGHTLSDNSCPDGYGWNVPQSILKLEPEIDESLIAGEAELFAFIGI